MEMDWLRPQVHLSLPLSSGQVSFFSKSAHKLASVRFQHSSGFLKMNPVSPSEQD